MPTAKSFVFPLFSMSLGSTAGHCVRRITQHRAGGGYNCFISLQLVWNPSCLEKGDQLKGVTFMKNFIRFSFVAIIAATLAGYGTTRLEAKAEYTKKEGQKCVYCHVSAGSKELNDTGKCYAKNDHSLKTCKAPDTKKDAPPPK